jgi:hypothetical protein
MNQLKNGITTLKIIWLAYTAGIRDQFNFTTPTPGIKKRQWELLLRDGLPTERLPRK